MVDAGAYAANHSLVWRDLFFPSPQPPRTRAVLMCLCRFAAHCREICETVTHSRCNNFELTFVLRRLRGCGRTEALVRALDTRREIQSKASSPVGHYRSALRATAGWCHADHRTEGTRTEFSPLIITSLPFFVLSLEVKPRVRGVSPA